MGIVDRIRNLSAKRDTTSVVERIRNLNKPSEPFSKTGGGTSGAIAPSTFVAPTTKPIVKQNDSLVLPGPFDSFKDLSAKVPVPTPNALRTTGRPGTSVSNFRQSDQVVRRKESVAESTRLRNIKDDAKKQLEIIEPQYRQALRDKDSAKVKEFGAEVARLKGITKPFALGVFEGTTPFSGTKAISESLQQPETIFNQAKEQPGFGAGTLTAKLGAQLVQYGTINNALKGVNAASKLGQLLGGSKLAKFGATQAIDLFADAIVQTPFEVIESIKNDDTLGEASKKILINRGIDSVINLVIGSLGKEGRETIQSLFKSSPEAVETALKNISPTDAKIVRETLGVKPTAFEPEKLGPTLAQPTKGTIDATIPLSPGIKTFEPPTTKAIDDFQAWRSKNFGGATGKQSPDDIDTLRNLYFEDTGKYIGDADLKTFTKSQGGLAIDATKKRFPVIEPKDGPISAPSVNPIVDRVKNLTQPKASIVDRVKALQQDAPIKQAITPDAVKTVDVAKPKPVEVPVKADLDTKAIPKLPEVKKVEPIAPKLAEVKKVEVKKIDDIKTPEVGTSKSGFTDRLEKVFKDDPSASVLVKEIKKIDKLATTTDAVRIDLAREILARDFDKAVSMVKTGERFNNGIESEIARQALDTLQQAGKVNESVEIIEAIARKARDVGQQMQLLKQWSKFTPEGMQKWAVNTFKKADVGVDAKIVDQLGTEIKAINTASTEELADMVAKRVGKKIKKVDDIVDGFITDSQFEKIVSGKVNNKTAIEILQKQVDKLDIRVGKESLEKLVSDLKQLENLDEKQLKELVKNTLVNDGVSIKTATNASKMYNFEELKALNTAVAMSKVMDKIPITVSKKMATFQAMQYLLNVRTFNRNLRGNLGSVIGEQINKLPSAGFDRLIGLKTGQRSVVSEIPKWSREFDKIKEGFNQGKKSAYEIKLGIGRGNTGKYEALFGQAFKNKGIQKPLAAGERLLRYSLETPDEFFKGWMASDSLYTSVRARLGKQVKNMSLDEVVSKATMDEVREAADYARYVTFQNDSYLANFLSSAKRGLNKETGKFISRFVPQAESLLNADFGLGNLVIPFTRVPGNIITRGLEYSPLGYLQSTRDIAKLFKASSDVPVAFQRQLAQKLGRATTGTGIVATGVFLANKGIITGDSGTDNFDKSALDRAQGSGGYKLNISALNRLITGKDTEWKEGDNVHSYSGVEPFSVPLAVGAKIASELTSEEQKEWYKGKNFKKALDAGANATWEETLDLPSLYTIKKMFFESMDKTNPDGTEKEGLDNFTSIMSVPLKEAIPGLTIPSWMRQAAQTIDPVQRETRGENQIVDKIKANIPFLSKTLPPKLDPLGKVQKRKEGVIANLVSPAFETKFKPIAFAKDLDKVAGKTEGNIYPSRKAPNSFSYRSETLSLTAEEKQQWLKTQGAIIEEQYTKLLNSVNVDTISQEQLNELAKQLQSIKSEARDRAKFELLKNRGLN